MKNINEELFNFLQKDYGDPFKGKAIDPDMVEFNSPDFGFDNELMFEEKNDGIGNYSSNWKYFMDYTKKNPRFERVNNYIKYVIEQKESQDEFAKYSVVGKSALKQSSIAGKQGKKMN